MSTTSSQLQLLRRRVSKLRKNPVIDTLIWLGIAFFLIFIVGQRYIVKPYVVPSGSMIRTLGIGDHILAARFWFRFTDPQRGDIIVFHPNGKGDQVYASTTEVSDKVFVKRLIGLPGDWLRGKDGKLQLCSGPGGSGCKDLKEPYVSSPVRDGLYHVPEGRYFMMGDNRDFSDDSRTWGAIKKGQILGRAFSIYWPLTRIRFF